MDPWACQLFSGLADLHSIDVIHRNINPHKLLLSQDDLKIAGLGVFAFIAHKPTSQAKVAEFAAPEVVEERERESRPLLSMSGAQDALPCSCCLVLVLRGCRAASPWDPNNGRSTSLRLSGSSCKPKDREVVI